jgi:hypothetical protein
LDTLRRGRPFSFKGQLEMADDPVNSLRLFDKRDNGHFASTGGAQQRIYLINLAYYMGMEVYAVSEGLDNHHRSRHKLKACGCVQESYKCTHRRETERIEELSPETEEQTQHFRDGEDHLPVRNIQHKLLPHPLSPFLPAFGMTRWTESACLAGKHKQPLFSTVGTPDAGKSAHRIAAVKILLNHILDHRTEETILSLKPALVFSEKLRKVTKKHKIKNRVFWMTLTVNPCHGSRDDSKIVPGRRLADIHAL